MSSNSTPVRTNSGRPPLPIRKAKPNRLPPSSLSSSSSSVSSANPTKTQQPQQNTQPLVEAAEDLTQQQSQPPHFMMHRDKYHGEIPPISLADTSDTSLNSMSSRSLASVLSNPREAIRDGGEQWRKHGKIFRAKLLMKDEESGGNFFVLSNNCEIERYYDVAEKVCWIRSTCIRCHTRSLFLQVLL
jgi:hypothetical protein